MGLIGGADAQYVLGHIYRHGKRVNDDPAAAARARGFGVMVGCMVATSLAMAPAMLVAQGVQFVDLDGPLLLARDRPHGLDYGDGMVHPPTPRLWG